MYFPLFKRHGWGKRLGEGRRHNGAMMPLVDGFIILKFSSFSTGNLSAVPQPRGMHQQAGGHTRPPLRQNRELVHWQELRYRWPAGRCGHRPLHFHHVPFLIVGARIARPRREAAFHGGCGGCEGCLNRCTPVVAAEAPASCSSPPESNLSAFDEGAQASLVFGRAMRAPTAESQAGTFGAGTQVSLASGPMWASAPTVPPCPYGNAPMRYTRERMVAAAAMPSSGTSSIRPWSKSRAVSGSMGSRASTGME